jgi:putative ABC transport system substrate-binding protein
MGAFVAFPAIAQQRARIYRIGWLSSGARSPAGTRNASFEAFKQALRELGYVEGRNLVVEERYGEGSPEVTAQRAAELAKMQVNLILATTTTATAAAGKATKTIPIVMGSAANPLATGLVASLSRPGGNITGLTLETSETAGKRLELLQAALPRMRRVAAIHPAEMRDVPAVAQWVKDSAEAARRLGLAFSLVGLHQMQRDTWDDVLRKAAAEGLNAATVMETPTYLAYRVRLAELMLKHRIGAMFGFREHAEVGGLMAYGADLTDLYRRAAGFVDKVLKGAKPGDLPVEQPTKFTFIVNLATARALELTLPQSILVRADEAIQ